MIDYERFLSATGRQLQESAIRRMGTVMARGPDMVSFAAGYPDPSVFGWADIRAIADELLASEASDALQYGPTRGYEPLIAQIAAELQARGITASMDEILVTSGSQQGINLAARLFVEPGDTVLVELPTFTGAIAAFRNMQARLAGVRQDAEGLDLDHLDEVWARERRSGRSPKLLYVIPNFHNPTGVLLSLARRRQLVDWAGDRDVLIVEDDPYGSLYFEDMATAADTRPVKADDRTGRVIYLSTVSKTLAPGLRVGWMTAHPALIDRLDTAKQSADLMTGSLDQRIVHEAMRRGVIARLAPVQRALYRRKRDALQQALRGAVGGRLSWSVPKGGFFLWARLPEGCTDTELLERALQQRLVFVVGSAFFVDGSGHDTIRLSFSAPPIERLIEGVARLAAALDAAPVGR